MSLDKLDSDELLRLTLEAINADRNPEALSLLKTLLERDPDHMFATYLLAAQHAQLGMMDRAEAGFRRSVELAPEFPMARFQYGQLLLVKGDAAGAKSVLAPLLGLPADQALGHYARGLVAAGGEDVAAAMAHLQAGLACPQEIPMLEADMRRVLGNLAQLQGAAAAPPVPAVNTAPLFLSNYKQND